jgi:hypothetical protein
MHLVDINKNPEAPLEVLLALLRALDAAGGPEAFEPFVRRLAPECAAEAGTHDYDGEGGSNRKARLFARLAAFQMATGGVLVAIGKLMNDDAIALALAAGAEATVK